MINAKEELQHEIYYKLQENVKVLCGYVEYKNEEYLLPVNYTELDTKEFLNNLNFKYDDGYGIQELFGVIWITDDSWFERREYDGAEWWQHMTRPSIPDKLLNGTENA